MSEQPLERVRASPGIAVITLELGGMARRLSRVEGENETGILLDGGIR